MDPVKTRDYDGGVHVYYALPVDGGGTGVFEHVSTWPDRADAQAEITKLEAADAYRTSLAVQARDALTAWQRTEDGPGIDDEHAAAIDIADVLDALLAELHASGMLLISCRLWCCRICKCGKRRGDHE